MKLPEMKREEWYIAQINLLEEGVDAEKGFSKGFLQ